MINSSTPWIRETKHIIRMSHITRITIAGRSLHDQKLTPLAVVAERRQGGMSNVALFLEMTHEL